MRQTILVLNPNSSERTTAMMVGIAAGVLPEGFAVEGATAIHSAPMIIDEAALTASAEGVVALGRAAAERDDIAGIIVAAFGDPGLEELRAATAKPVVGLCESGMAAAAAGGRRFGVATTTPGLVRSIAAKAADLGYGEVFTGVRVPEGDPLALAADPAAQFAALKALTLACIREDGAEAVIIGGGPLGQTALELASELDLPVIAPIPEAVRRLVGLLREAGRSRP